MKITLRIDINGHYWDGGACIEVPELYIECFKPLKTCDDRLLSVVTGDVMAEEAEIIMKVRDDAATILAKKLTEMIILEMKKNDTHNGYKKS